MNKENIMELEKRLFDAMVKDDIIESEKLMDDDMIFVNHFGEVISKEEDINSHKLKIFKIQSIDVKKQTVSLFQNVAVAISETMVKASINGQEQTDYLLYSHTWQKKKTALK